MIKKICFALLIFFSSSIVAQIQSVRINELDPDQPGTDSKEFVELYGPANASLDGLVLVFYNGGLGQNNSYSVVDLAGYALNAQGFFLVASQSLLDSLGLFGAVLLSQGASGDIQNGPDAIALYAGSAADWPNGTNVTANNLIDAVVYGTNDPDATVLLSVLVPGQAQLNVSGNDTTSFSRFPDGGQALNLSSFQVSAISPGSANLPCDACIANPIAGCTDVNACNYNPDATEDDGSCVFPGCNDTTACNFNELAGCADGSCVFPGCTDTLACNYAPSAGCNNNGSCIYLNTITRTSAAGTNAQTRCLNSAIVNITYATTGATGANVTGLPAGVNGTWSANVFTISGTPTVTGTFNYSIGMTGGCVGSNNTATGSITVTASNSLALTSAAGTNAQTRCIFTDLSAITYATTGATGATFSGLPPGVSGSWSANTIVISGTPSAIGNYNYTITLTGGCGNVVGNGSINVTNCDLNNSANAVPYGLSYQAVVRGNNGQALAEQNVTFRFSLLTGNINGAAEYVETQSLTTSALGLVNTIFGTGEIVSGTYDNIDWTSGSKFLKVEINTDGAFVEIGRQQLWSTPYAEHSRTSSSIKNQALPVFDNNAAALAGGLQAGDMYRRLNGDLKIVY